MDENLVKYSKTESFTHPNEISHPLFRVALSKYWDISRKIEIASFSDVKSGTGLGSSSTFGVALISLLHGFQKLQTTPII